MSLINEALKRARLEAARQDAAKKGYVLSSDQSLQRISYSGAKPARKWVLVGMVTLVIAIAGIALFYFGIKRSGSKQRTAGLTTTEAPSARLDPYSDAAHQTIEIDFPSDSPVAQLDPEIEPDVDPALEPSQQQPEDLTQSPPSQSSGSDLPTLKTAAGTGFGSVTSQALGSNRTLRESSTQTAAVVDQGPPDIEPGERATNKAPILESYEREFTLDDGTRVELGGIAWSESGPYALVDGRVVGVGEFVGNLVIESIHPTHIFLKGRNRLVRLTLR